MKNDMENDTVTVPFAPEIEAKTSQEASVCMKCFPQCMLASVASCLQRVVAFAGAC